MGSAAGPSAAAPPSILQPSGAAPPGLLVCQFRFSVRGSPPARRGAVSGSGASRRTSSAQRHRAAPTAATPCQPPRAQPSTGGASRDCGATLRSGVSMLGRLVPRLLAAGEASSCSRSQGPPCSAGSSLSVPTSPRHLPGSHRAASLTTLRPGRPLNLLSPGGGVLSAARVGGFAAGLRFGSG